MILFIVGILLGGTLGCTIASLMSVARGDDDMDDTERDADCPLKELKELKDDRPDNT